MRDSLSSSGRPSMEGNCLFLSSLWWAAPQSAKIRVSTSNPRKVSHMRFLLIASALLFAPLTFADLSATEQSLLDAAQKQIQAGRYAEAWAELDALIEEDHPDRSWKFPEAARYLKVACKIYEGDLQAAYDLANEYGVKSSYLLTGLLAASIGEYETAAAHLLRGDEQRRKSRSDHRLYASAILGRYALLEVAKESDDWSGTIANYVAGGIGTKKLLKAASKRGKGAEGRRLTQLRTSQAALVIALVADRRGRLDEAKEHYRKALKAGVDFEHPALWARARLAVLENKVGPVDLQRRKRLLWGYRDYAGKWVIPPQFSGASEFANGYAAVSIRDSACGGGFIDKSGKFVVSPITRAPTTSRRAVAPWSAASASTGLSTPTAAISSN